MFENVRKTTILKDRLKFLGLVFAMAVITIILPYSIFVAPILVAPWWVKILISITVGAFAGILWVRLFLYRININIVVRFRGSEANIVYRVFRIPLIVVPHPFERDRYDIQDILKGHYDNDEATMDILQIAFAYYRRLI